MNKRLLLIIIGIISVHFAAMAQPPKVFVMNAERLIELKKKVKQQDKQTLQLVDKLRKEADELLTMRPVSVMDKTITPVSGNKHDYMSQAPYFWYDSSKPNGLPYIRRDGERNPEINKITDRTNLGKLENASKILSLAWYLTGEEKYAEKASTLLRNWFLNEETKMNPHLEYGQGIPGINTGRGIGIIETRALISVVDAAGLLEGSKSWTNKDHKGLQNWFSQYLHWLLNSKYGKDEHAAKNNHGTWYYAQAASFALFSNNTTKAKELIEESKKRIDSQINKEGKMQLEIDRTRGLSYSSMNLLGWFNVATLGEHVGINLWKYTNKENASLLTALDWLIPYAVGEKNWPYQQITPYTREYVYMLLLQAADVYKDQKYAEYAKKIDGEVNDVMIDLLYGK